MQSSVHPKKNKAGHLHRTGHPLNGARIKKPGPTRTDLVRYMPRAEAYPVTEWSRLPEGEADVA